MNTMGDIFERIKANNPWWISSSLILEDSLIKEFEEQKFRYFYPLLQNLSLHQDAVLTIRGPRRVGKSTLLRLLIKRLLLEEKIPKEAIFFYPCDRVENYNQLFEIVKTYLDFARPRIDSRLFIFLDEISFVKDWQRAIKEMVDNGLLKKSLTILTGSSILDLKFGSEFLSGRRGQISPSDIFYYPLSFADFVNLVNPKLGAEKDEFSLSYYLPKLDKLFHDFLLTGGFPKTINEYYTSGRIANSTYETFITWVENDLHKTNRNEKTAYDLLANLYRTLTTPVSFTSLAKDSSIASHFAVQEYIDILEKMFVLFPLNAFVIEQKRRDPKKNKKIYFTDPFIFNALYVKTQEQMEDPFSSSQKKIDELMPLIAENIVASYLKRIYSQLYWGKGVKGEIDFVGKKERKLNFFEVKYREKIDYSDIPSVSPLTVISRKHLTEKPVKTIPLEIFLLSRIN